ncbi:condensin complex subunit 2 [Ixodes scapularis]
MALCYQILASQICDRVRYGFVVQLPGFKITQKNAFSLHLIDHLKEIVQSKDGSTNFQAASCTLDASAKIYAYRVDRVFTEALQIASELGIPSRAKKNKGKGEEDEEAAAAPTDDAPKKPAKGRKASTLVRNKKTITLDKVEAAKPIDTLMESIRNSSVEGTAASSFLNHLSLQSDVGGLALFLGPSQQKVDAVRGDATLKIPLDVRQKVLENNLKICSDYYLDHLWGRCSEVETERRSPDISSCSRLASTNNEPLDEPSAEDAPSFHDDGGDGIDQDHSTLLDSPPNKSIRFEGPDDISQFLAAVPGDYSYFTKSFPSAPAGPEHWRLRLMNRPKPDKAPDKGRKKAEKVVPLLDFDELQPDLTCFARTKKKNVLEKAVVGSWTSSKLLLPRNLHPKVPILSTFVLNKERKIGKTTTAPSSAMQPKDEDYTYDAADDNFCPDTARIVETCPASKRPFPRSAGKSLSVNEKRAWEAVSWIFPRCRVHAGVYTPVAPGASRVEVTKHWNMTRSLRGSRSSLRRGPVYEMALQPMIAALRCLPRTPA